MNFVQSQRFADGDQIHPLELNDFFVIEVRMSCLKAVGASGRDHDQVAGGKVVFFPVAEIVQMPVFEKGDDHIAAEFLAEENRDSPQSLFMGKRTDRPRVLAGQTPVVQNADLLLLEISGENLDISLFLSCHFVRKSI